MRTPTGTIRTLVVWLAVAMAFSVPACQAGPVDNSARNVIVMIADGAGQTTFDAASYYEHGRLGKQQYDRWPVKLTCTTWALSPNVPPHADPGDQAVNRAVTDSAAAATAICTGVKTTLGRINTNPAGRSLTSIGQIAKQSGRRVGVVTSVQFSHATPACMAAHNESRNNYEQIAAEMIRGETLDVIMGCGHPEYDDDGRRVAAGQEDYRYVGGQELWQAIRNGVAPGERKLIETRAEFLRLVRAQDDPPQRVIAIPQVHRTLQYSREGKDAGQQNTNVPDLATMTLAALNVLGRDDSSFLLMVESGAVDWANHANNLPRTIEEQTDFNHAIEAVVKWLIEHGQLNQTLVIVTADHETGGLRGLGPKPDGASVAPITGRGKGSLPAAEYATGTHTGAPVPLFVTGPGARLFLDLAIKEDGVAATAVDNTDIFQVIARSLAGSAEPPAVSPPDSDNSPPAP
ncbi:MAG: alkaline phosphatase [Planctomycetota bacterium]